MLEPTTYAISLTPTQKKKKKKERAQKPLKCRQNSVVHRCNGNDENVNDWSHHPPPPFYNANAANPARITAVLIMFEAAPPSNVGSDGTGVEPPMVPLGDVVALLFTVPLPGVAVTKVKLAQVKRVELLAWMTMERLPKKDAGPLSVDR
jgi:hypothetical protein